MIEPREQTNLPRNQLLIYRMEKKYTQAHKTKQI